MKRGALYSVCSLALLIWGCPKRQTAVRVVYAPAPPAAATPAPAEESGALVIEEPSPPEPEAVTPAEPASPQPTPRRRRPRTEPATTPEGTAEAVEPPSAEVPALEPRESPAQQATLRQQILDLQESLRQRTARLLRLKMTNEARKTLDDARTFLLQSEQALRDADLQRAHNLANKAALLVSALEQR